MRGIPETLRQSAMAFFHRHRFVILLVLAVWAIRAIPLLLSLSLHPPQTWLGAVLLNADDQAVYLSQIEDIREGGWGMRNWYAPLPQTRFINPLYFALGLVARFTHLPGAIVHEFGWFLSVALALILFSSIIKRLTDHEASYQRLTVLTVFAGGLGWAGTIWFSFHGGATTFYIPDLMTETYFIPSLFMAAHIPLSIALLPFSLLAIWRLLVENERWRFSTVLAPPLLLLLHPYFVPIMGLFSLYTLLFAWKKRRQQMHFWLLSVWAGLAALALSPHAWMMLQNPSRRFLLTGNHLELAPPLILFLSSVPWTILIFLRRSLSSRLTHKERWIAVWIGTVFLTLLLPFAWKRKIIESSGLALIWLAWPALLIVWQKWKRCRPLFFAVFLVPVFLTVKLLSGIFVLQSPSGPWFVSPAVMQSWLWIHEHSPTDAIVLAESPGLGIWTPVFARRESFIGHPFETPDFEKKKQTRHAVFHDALADDVPALLDTAGANVMLTISPEASARLQRAIKKTSWNHAADFGEVNVWIKKP